MISERLGAVFFPHGLGHLLGIDTHDPGGYLKVFAIILLLNFVDPKICGEEDYFSLIIDKCFSIMVIGSWEA